MDIQQIALLLISLVFSAGVLVQIITNAKNKRAEFLSFELAVLLLLPYIPWSISALLAGDMFLLGIMVLNGSVSMYLGAQYFIYEWHMRKLDISEKFALALIVIGLLMMIGIALTGNILLALQVAASIFTFSMIVYGLLAKMYRIFYKGENLQGLNITTLVVTSLLYAFMALHGYTTANWWLFGAYMFGLIVAIAATIFRTRELTK